MKKNNLAPCPKISNDCKNEQLELSLLLKMFRGVHPVLVMPDVHGCELAEKLGGGGAIAACTSCKAAKTGGWLSVFSAWRQKA